MSTRRPLRAHLSAATLLVAVGGLLPGDASAHHGWSGTEPGHTELDGMLVEARLGDPHGRLTLAVDGEEWIVETGPTWRNDAAELHDRMLIRGAHVKISGHRSARPGERLVQAERLVIDGRFFDLYPERD